MYLGIDIGTSSVKLSLVSQALEQTGEASAPLVVSTPRADWSEQAPEDWWQALAQACARLASTHDLSQVRAIGLSGQMHGAVLLDAGGGVIRPAILWNDGRSHRECETMAASVPEIGTLAGVPPLPGFTAPKLLWLKAHEPDHHARIARVLLPKDYIGWRLHGRYVTDRSDAAGTLWLDQARARWSAQLCAASATDPGWLPEVRAGTETAGSLRSDPAHALGLPPGIPIAAGGGDAATGAAGIGAITEGASFLSLGTSGQLFVATASYRPNPEHMVHAYCHTVPDMWFQMAAMLNGARPMQWFADLVRAPLPDLLAEAAHVPPREAPLFLPYLTGERSPHADPHIRSGFYGLADGMVRGHMMRGIVNAIAYSFADAADSLLAAGTRVSDLLAIGGGARSDLLLQTIADVLGTPIGRSSAPATGPALGAARLAAVACGGATLDDIAKRPDVEAVFEPTNDDGHAEGLAGYRALYCRLRGIHQEMTSR